MTESQVTWPLLDGLSVGEREQLLALARPRTFARAAVVCHAGDPADSMHLVAEGRLAVQVSLDTGESSMINLLGPGDYFGELALLDRTGGRTATVSALEDSRTLVIGAQAFTRLRESNPSFERTLTVLLAHRVDILSQRLLEAMYVDLDTRLRRRLVELSRSYSSGDGRVRIPLTQTQLAGLVGGTRQSVNQALQRLAEAGIVVVQRGQVEVDVRRLELLTER
jgi:CRP/FNR family cyclic AMP-dependent transcriptional regulator